MRFFTSDEHFDHRNIIDFCRRPFTDVKEMKEKLIENHNSVVKAGDLVYHLGDMFWRTLPLEDAIGIAKSLNGQHFYIYGNHDELFKNKALRDCFVWCRDVENLKIPGLPNIWLSHYAHRVWNGSHRGAYHLYGHTHAVMPEDSSLSFDVGVDAQNFLPISLDEVVEKMKVKAEAILSKYWSCEDKNCKHKFDAIDAEPKICSKCGSGMKLLTKVKGQPMEDRP